MTIASDSANHLAQLLSSCPIPTLASSMDALSELKLKDDELLPADIAHVVLRDPLFTLLVLRYMQERKNNKRLSEITTTQHALMMLGVEPFFAQFGQTPAVEDMGLSPIALQGVYRVAKRSYIASRLAQNWAARKVDMESEELQVAALIHDMAELLLWIHSPEKAQAISLLMKADPTLRSAQAQTIVLGAPLNKTQDELCALWGLPELSRQLLSEQGQATPRMQCARLATRLARHSFYGFDNPALPDDWKDCAQLLGISSASDFAAKMIPYIQTLSHRWDKFQRPPLSFETPEALG